MTSTSWPRIAGGRRAVHQHPRRRPRSAVPRLRHAERRQVRRASVGRRVAVDGRAAHRRFAGVDRRAHRSHVSRLATTRSSSSACYDLGDATSDGDSAAGPLLFYRAGFGSFALYDGRRSARCRRARVPVAPASRSCRCRGWAVTTRAACWVCPFATRCSRPVVELVVGAGLVGGVRLPPLAALGQLARRLHRRVDRSDLAQRDDAPPCACFGSGGHAHHVAHASARNVALIAVALVSVAA